MFFYNESNNETLQGQPESSGIVSDNLTFHLDSSNTNSYPGTGTTWTSLVNSSHVGTFAGDPTFNPAEANSIDLDGNDHIEINDSSLFDFSGDFTIGVWMKLDQIGQSAGASVVWSTDVLDQFQFHIVPSSPTTMSLGINNSMNNFVVSSSPVGRWMYLVFSRTSGVISAYENGALIGTSSNNGSINCSAFYLGVQTPSRVPFYGHYTDGKFGALEVYSDGLTGAEVLQNFEAEKSRFGL